MNQNVARRPRFRRVSDFPQTRLTDRDKAILAGVSRHRFLTTSQILSLVPGSRQNISRRLQRLFHAGFLDRPKAQLPLRFSGELSDFVYCSTRIGDSIIADQSGRTESGRGFKPVTSLFLAHALLVSEALIRIELACPFEGVVFIPETALIEWTNDGACPNRIQWRTSLKCGTRTEIVGVVPDAAFAIERREISGGTGLLHFFLEADRGTMPIYRRSLRLSSIRRKALAYSQSRKRHVLREKFGIPGFQVMFVTRSEERLERIKEVCRAATDGKDTSLFLFATTGELRQEKARILFS